MTYPGGKAGSGVYQKIINLMPKHRVYVEPFLGAGAILKNKKPAEFNFAGDMDREALRAFLLSIGESGFTSDSIIGFGGFYKDRPLALRWIDADGHFRELLDIWIFPSDVLVYADPPYIAAECAPGRPIYKYDMPLLHQHEEFLARFIALPCMKMISHYECELYNTMLAGWRKVHFLSPTRRGMKRETVYLSFPEPTELHDYSFLGDTFREREKIKIKRRNWENKIRRMPVLERSLLFEVIDDIRAMGGRAEKSDDTETEKI